VYEGLTTYRREVDRTFGQLKDETQWLERKRKQLNFRLTDPVKISIELIATVTGHLLTNLDTVPRIHN
jgi:hypothetical protein